MGDRPKGKAWETYIWVLNKLLKEEESVIMLGGRINTNGNLLFVIHQINMNGCLPFES